MTHKKSMQKKRHVRARKLARLYGVVTTLLFGVYFSAGFFVHPAFLFGDVRQKMRVLGDTVNVFARVLDPPQKPVVTGVGVCASGGPKIQLDWADDVNSTSYDITRDGLPLTTGVIASGYEDGAVSLGTTYSYVVTALGPMGPGFNESDSVSVTAPSECTPDIVPAIEVQTFAGNAIAGTVNRHFTTDRNPRFTGTTNLLGARIDIVAVSNHETVMATVFANAAGYFEWSYSGRLDMNDYDVLFTATDIVNPALSATGRVKIGIEKELAEIKRRQQIVETATEGFISEVPIQKRSMLDVSVMLSGTEFYAGDIITATLRVGAVPSDFLGKSATVILSILDGEGKVINESTEDIILQSGFEWGREFKVPSSMVGQDYHVVGELVLPGYRVSREEAFQVLELPLFKLGGTMVTYENVVSKIGWISFGFLFLSLWWLLLFVREYYLYAQSRRHIWGRDLHSAGYF